MLILALAPRAASQGYPPGEAVSKMTSHAGVHIQIIASEPQIRQPILVKCDDRGRLWTIQYLQYPNPAGLKRVSVDRWSRTVYDRVPEPPPRGPRGADRITIIEDADADGRGDRFTDFIDGLNLCTGIEFGFGGVFVLQVPYLLFYPDRNRDDVPDSDPEVLLSGFGMEDAQAMVNHITWGPDGWLYGVNGSTTTCRVRGFEFQQGCWRYHPRTKAFELFCEGGQNTFGLTFDDRGELYYSTNGGPFVHAWQGASFYKTFGKHGPLHHRFAYGFLEPLKVDQVPGGPPTGGTIYREPAFPFLMGKFVAGNFLGHTVSSWNLTPAGATVEASWNNVLLNANDTWFGPTDLAVGPRGEIYVSDFCDARTAHPDPDARWDTSNGRIYRLAPATLPAAPLTPLADLPTSALLEHLVGPSGWLADRARVELASRQDLSARSTLADWSASPEERRALAGLWGLAAIDSLDDDLLINALAHPSPAVRKWAVQLSADTHPPSPALTAALIERAPIEQAPIVLAQLAASARRIPQEAGIKLALQLLASSTDLPEPRIDLSIWWAIETRAMDERGRILATLAHRDEWNRPAARAQILRLIRRYAADATSAGSLASTELLQSAPEDHQRDAWSAVNAGLAERFQPLAEIDQGGLFQDQATPTTETQKETSAPPSVDDSPLALLARSQHRDHPRDRVLLESVLRLGVEGAADQLKDILSDVAAVEPADIELARFLDESDRIRSLEPLIDSTSESVQRAAIKQLVRSDDASLTGRWIRRLIQADVSPSVAGDLRRALLGRAPSARQLLQMVDQGRLSAQAIPVTDLKWAALHNDPEVGDLLKKHWGNIRPGTTEEKLATMRRLSNDLRADKGEPERGKGLFTKHCGNCHQLFGEGEKIGPDLTTANRHDRAALLGNILDPSAVVRREYQRWIVETADGRLLAGLIVAEDGASLTLADEKGLKTRIERGEIESMKVSDVSLMPEGLLELFSPQELRDLFAYLEKDATAAAPVADRPQ
jgi:putative heme-binding domain-containing protein